MARSNSVRDGSTAINADFQAVKWSSVLIEQITSSCDMNGQSEDILPDISIPTGTWKRLRNITLKKIPVTTAQTVLVIVIPRGFMPLF